MRMVLVQDIGWNAKYFLESYYPFMIYVPRVLLYFYDIFQYLYNVVFIISQKYLTW